MARKKTDDEIKTTISKRIAELEAKRDEMVRAANLQVATFNGAIEELKSMLNTLEKTHETDGDMGK